MEVNDIIELENIEIEVVTDPKEIYGKANELESIIFDLNSKIEMLSSKADKWDYLVALGLGIVCGIIDVFCVGEFSLARGKITKWESRLTVQNLINDFLCRDDVYVLK